MKSLAATPAPLQPRTRPDEQGARRSLREQIARLEEELAELFCSTWPRKGHDWRGPSRSGPRLLGLAELEELRDGLAARVAEAKRMLSERTDVEEQHRRLVEEMLVEPERHKWARVANELIGEPGCTHWHVRPRWGLLGMLMNWWRVVVSSGCPLAVGPLLAARHAASERGRPRPGAAGRRRPARHRPLRSAPDL
jgi:hypothetical protein